MYGALESICLLASGQELDGANLFLDAFSFGLLKQKNVQSELFWLIDLHYLLRILLSIYVGSKPKLEIACEMSFLPQLLISSGYAGGFS